MSFNFVERRDDVFWEDLKTFCRGDLLKFWINRNFLRKKRINLKSKKNEKNEKDSGNQNCEKGQKKIKKKSTYDLKNWKKMKKIE